MCIYAHLHASCSVIVVVVVVVLVVLVVGAAVGDTREKFDRRCRRRTNGGCKKDKVCLAHCTYIRIRSRRPVAGTKVPPTSISLPPWHNTLLRTTPPVSTFALPSTSRPNVGPKVPYPSVFPLSVPPRRTYTRARLRCRVNIPGGEVSEKFPFQRAFFVKLQFSCPFGLSFYISIYLSFFRLLPFPYLFVRLSCSMAILRSRRWVLRSRIDHLRVAKHVEDGFLHRRQGKEIKRKGERECKLSRSPRDDQFISYASREPRTLARDG